MRFAVMLTARELAPHFSQRHAPILINHDDGMQPNRTRLKIAAFTKAWSTHSFGGLGKHADNLYRSLAERGHTVHVFTTAIRPVRD